MDQLPDQIIDWENTGGLTSDELRIYNLLNYDILSDPDYKPFEFRLTNALHLLQHVFMWRAMIRINLGKFWVKSDQPYENNAVLNNPPHSERYADFIQSLMLFYMGVQDLEPYHPSMLDDVRRGINEIFDLIGRVENEKQGNLQT